MTYGEPFASTPPWRKRVGTVIALLGVAVVGGQLARAWPREVEIAYRAGPEAREVDVEIVQDGRAVASARFHRASADGGFFRHAVSLQPGEYRLEIRVYGPNGRGVEHSRLLVVPAEGVTRFDLRE